MHEMSLAQSVIDSVLREMASRNLAAIKKIVLRIGPWSGVMADALQFNYDILRADTPLSGTELVIQETGLRVRCSACAQEFAVHDFLDRCPRCQSKQIQLIGGDEMDIAYLET